MPASGWARSVAYAAHFCCRAAVVSSDLSLLANPLRPRNILNYYYNSILRSIYFKKNRHQSAGGGRGVCVEFLWSACAIFQSRLRVLYYRVSGDDVYDSTCSARRL